MIDFILWMKKENFMLIPKVEKAVSHFIEFFALSRVLSNIKLPGGSRKNIHLPFKGLFSMKIIFYWSNRFKELTLTYKTIQRKSQLLNQIIIPVFFIRNPSVLKLFLIQCVKNPQVLLNLLFVWISKKLINAELV